MKTAWIHFVGAISLLAVAGCATAQRLPRFQPESIRADPAWNDSAQGRVLVKFYIDKHRKPYGATILEASSASLLKPSGEINLSSAARPRLTERAVVLINNARFDPTDHTRTNATTPYKVTVIFCLKDMICGRIPAYPDSVSVVVPIEIYRELQPIS